MFFCITASALSIFSFTIFEFDDLILPRLCPVLIVTVDHATSSTRYPARRQLRCADSRGGIPHRVRSTRKSRPSDSRWRDRRSPAVQISIPPPYNVLDRHVSPKDRLAAEVGYERKMFAEIDEIVAAIPKQELAIQWDAAHEVQNLEGAREGWFDTLEQEEEEIIDRLVRLGDHIPDGVELGYHLCYGDFGHRHVIEPKDTGLMVRLANKLSERVRRSIQWIHMPVPRKRSDDAYFAPLSDLRLNPETELYLGLVHHSDGVAGTRQRIAAAAKVIPDFGIATECGMGRRDPKTMFELLRVHAEVTDMENA